MKANNYNGQREKTVRIYDSLRNFVGRNRVYKPGDVLCVSTRNNDVYDLFLMADGTSDFITLLKGGSFNPSGNKIIVTEEDEGNTMRVKIV